MSQPRVENFEITTDAKMLKLSLFFRKMKGVKYTSIGFFELRKHSCTLSVKELVELADTTGGKCVIEEHLTLFKRENVSQTHRTFFLSRHINICDESRSLLQPPPDEQAIPIPSRPGHQASSLKHMIYRADEGAGFSE